MSITDAGLAPAAAVERASDSPISWSAILAGAAAALGVAAALTSVLAGFGFKASTPWALPRGGAPGFTPALGAGLVAVQVLSSGLGGYLAGRLRVRWPDAHADEVHFRDTAHGLLVWAVSTVVGAMLAATVLAPYADALSAPAAVAGVLQAHVAAGDVGLAQAAQLAAAQAQRANDIAAQSAFFLGLGLLLSAFVAAVAAALGGLQREEMHRRA
jgi:hypothetical protein